MMNLCFPERSCLVGRTCSVGRGGYRVGNSIGNITRRAVRETALNPLFIR